ncbi:MAG: acyl-CoA dehydrogenase [Gammaproteobacteria bacterium]|nr:acyl-CoA dehydrogenase [Gammaproteobacteria bacterium]
MNFDFSDEQKLLREQVRRFLEERAACKRARALVDAGGGFDEELWQEMAELGWLGAVVPDEFGGAGLGQVDLCVIAEELGRANAAVPFISSVYLVTQALLCHGNHAQQNRWLPKLVAGDVVGALASHEAAGPLTPSRVRAQISAGELTGRKSPVADGKSAQLLVVLAREGAGYGLYLAETGQAGMEVRDLEMTDPSRPAASVSFDGVPVERLGTEDGWAVLDDLWNRAVVLAAFEQVGGAQACLDMAKEYANERFAFGRPIGSFQAIKHKLADVYIATELARSNAYYGAWALQADAPELPLAAAAARVAGCRAFELAAKENIQVHGGMGFTWELDCHLYYRRAKSLGLALGSARVWKDRLVGRIEARNAPQAETM